MNMGPTLPSVSVRKRICKANNGTNFADLYPQFVNFVINEDVFNLVKRTARSLREAEQDVDKGREVEGTEDTVCLPADAGETWWDSPGESEVEEPGERGRDGSVVVRDDG